MIGEVVMCYEVHDCYDVIRRLLCLSGLMSHVWAATVVILARRLATSSEWSQWVRSG